MRFLFTTTIWGEKYVSDFLNISLPTQLAFGNLADFPWLDRARYMIMTTSEDANSIKKAPIMRRLNRLMEVQYVMIDEIPRHNKYIGVSLSQVEALRRTSAFDAIYFLYPDFICSTGSISNAAKKMVEGYDAVMFPIPAVLDNILDDPLVAKHNLITNTADGRVISIPPRLMVELSMRNPHPMLSGFFLGAKKRNLGSSYIMWDLSPQCWLFHCFHLHPFVIRVQKDNPDYLLEFNVSLDEEYVSRVFKTTDRIWFPKTSDEFATCSLRTQESEPQPIEGTATAINAIHWAEEYASLVQRDFVRIPFRWHSIPLTSRNLARWAEIEKRAAETINIIHERLRTPDSVVIYEDPLAHALRCKRRARFEHWRNPKYMTMIPEAKEDVRSSVSDVQVKPPSTIFGALLFIKRVTGLERLRRVPTFLRMWMWIRRKIG